jgi:lysozyme
MRISENGKNFLISQEGMVLKIYLDSVGKKTLGCGHLIIPEDLEYSLPVGTPITIDQAMDFLEKDLEIVERCINAYVTVDLSQNQYDSLCSFIFNCGVNSFASSTLLKKLNMGDFSGAAKEFEKWSKITVNGIKKVSPGLFNRRKREAELFSKEIA